MAEPANEPTSFWFKIIDSVASLLYRLGPWFFIFLIAREAAKVLIAYSGKQTLAHVAFQFIADFKIDKLLCYGVGIGGAAYGYKQKRLKEKTIVRLAPEGQERERRIDPDRTSSRLTPRGRTRREDEP